MISLSSFFFVHEANPLAVFPFLNFWVHISALDSGHEFNSNSGAAAPFVFFFLFLLLNSPWGCVWEIGAFASPSSIRPAHSLSFCNMIFMPKHSVQSRISLTLSGGGCATFSTLLSLSSSCRFLACGPDVNPPSTSSQPHRYSSEKHVTTVYFQVWPGPKEDCGQTDSLNLLTSSSFILSRTHWITTSKWKGLSSMHITATRYGFSLNNCHIKIWNHTYDMNTLCEFL